MLPGSTPAISTSNMSDKVTFQPVKVACPGQSEGRLVFFGGELIAVVTLLDETHEHFAGRWFAEAHFNSLRQIQDQTFGTLEEVESYITTHHISN